MSELTKLIDKPFSTTQSWMKHWGGEYKKNIELPWKSGYQAGSSNFGTAGGILGGTIRVATDWYFQNTGPYKDDNPAWSDAPGADDYLSSEQYYDKYGHYKGEVTTEQEEEKKKIVTVNGGGGGGGGGGDTPAASAALAALMRRRLKMRRGRSATVLTKGAKIGKGDKKRMAYA